MRLLLDTHVWIWNFADPASLSITARAALCDSSNELFLSPISTWEVLMLARKGRIRLDREPQAWVHAALAATPAVQLPITHEIAARSHDLSGYDNPDPADRFIVATALVHGLRLLTRDESKTAWIPQVTFW